MEVAYRHNYDSNLMVIRENDVKFNDFRINMIMKNDIKGLLNMFVGCINGEIELSYIISGKQSIRELYYKSKIGYKELMIIMQEIVSLAKVLREYLLKEDHIIMSLEYIFFSTDMKQVSFCYYPKNDEYFYDGFNGMLQDLLVITDHQDKRAVEFIYGILEICNRPGFLMKEVEEYLLDNNISNQSEIDYQKNTVEMNLDRNDNIAKVCEDNTLLGKIRQIFLGGKNKQIKKYVYQEPENDSIAVSEQNSIYLSNTTKKSEEEYDYENETMLISDILKDKKRKLFSMNEKDDIHISEYPFVIGKAIKKADGVINDNSISRLHAKIDFQNNEYYIEDLNSKNGTFVNDKIINPYEKIRIEIGDKITIAFFDYVFR